MYVAGNPVLTGLLFSFRCVALFYFLFSIQHLESYRGHIGQTGHIGAILTS